MRFTKKFLLASLLFVFGIFSAQAQKGQKGSPERRAEAQANSLIKKLSLDEARATQVRAIYAKYAPLQADAQAMAKGKEKRDALNKVRVDQDAELKAALTAEQYAQWQTLKAEQKAKSQEKADAKRAKKKAEKGN